MIPAMIASVLILYWWWRGSRSEPAAPDPGPGGTEDLQRELTALNARLARILDQLPKR